jgi:hypothetical protein
MTKDEIYWAYMGFLNDIDRTVRMKVPRVPLMPEPKGLTNEEKDRFARYLTDILVKATGQSDKDLVDYNR